MDAPQSRFDRMFDAESLARVKNIDTRFLDDAFHGACYVRAVVRMLDAQAREPAAPVPAACLERVRCAFERARYLYLDDENDVPLSEFARGWTFRRLYWVCECRMLDMQGAADALWRATSEKYGQRLCELELWAGVTPCVDFETLAESGMEDELRRCIRHLSERWYTLEALDADDERAVRALVVALHMCAARVIAADGARRAIETLVSGEGVDTMGNKMCAFFVFAEVTFRYMHKSIWRRTLLREETAAAAEGGDGGLGLRALRLARFERWLWRRIATFDDPSFFKEYVLQSEERLIALGAHEYVAEGRIKRARRLMRVTQGQARQTMNAALSETHAMDDRSAFFMLFGFGHLMLAHQVAFNEHFLLCEHRAHHRRDVDILCEEAQQRLRELRYPVVVENFHRYDVYYKGAYRRGNGTVVDALYRWMCIIQDDFARIVAGVDLYELYNEFNADE